MEDFGYAKVSEVRTALRYGRPGVGQSNTAPEGMVQKLATLRRRFFFGLSGNSGGGDQVAAGRMVAVHGHGAMCGSSRLLLVVEAVGDNPPQGKKSPLGRHIVPL